MTEGYRPGGACRSCGMIPRKSCRSPGPFLVISHYTIWTDGHNPSNTSCDPWTPSQLGAGRLPYRRMCTCVFSSHSFWTSSSLDVPAGVTQEEGHTGFLIHLLSAVRAFIFLARWIQPFLSLVDCEVEFCVLTI